jgi:hypothetical protein
MSKSKDNKTKSTNQLLTESMNTYDGTNYVYDGSDDTINTEQEMIKKYTPKPKVQTWDLMKQTADKKELRELRKIEKKMNYESKPFKKKPIDQRRESSEVKSDTTPALDIPNFLRKKEAAPVDDTLNKILEDRNKPDPDLFRGLGTFLTKKI